MSFRTALIALFLLVSTVGWSQQELITFAKFKRQVELPFEYVNDFIVVELVVNHIFKMKFIFDTGAENTIICKREYLDIFGVNYQRKISIYGADLKTELTAYIAPGIDFKIGNDLQVWSQSVLVLEEDYFRFEEYTGMEVHGILGADMLRRFVISIDFRRKKILIQDPTTFSGPPQEDYFVTQSDFYRYKPYFQLPAELIPEKPTELKLLMDTGASLPLLLYTNADTTLELPSQLIRTSIGYGIGGVIEGFIGRTRELHLGPHQLNSVLTRFQDISDRYELDSTFLNNRQGIMGNVILNRFSIIIDYPREAVYLKPNRNFTKEFTYDRSGISLVASGDQLNRINVIHVVAGSPADEAGIRKGDRIKSVNGLAANFIGLAGVVSRFRKRSGKKFNVVIIRDGERQKVSFRLREII